LHGVRIKVLAADLAQPNTPAEIFAFTEERGIAVDLLVNNAGIGSYGEFRASDLERELGIIHVNCSALVHFTHLYLPGMVERHSGAILIVSSTAAYQGVPYMATYAASKGFGLLFAEALAREVEHYGVRVCALCPGPTVRVPGSSGCAGWPFDGPGTSGPRGARRLAGARGRRTLSHLGIHELAWSGSPARGSQAVGHVSGRDAVPSRAPPRIPRDALVRSRRLVGPTAHEIADWRASSRARCAPIEGFGQQDGMARYGQMTRMRHIGTDLRKRRRLAVSGQPKVTGPMRLMRPIL